MGDLRAQAGGHGRRLRGAVRQDDGGRKVAADDPVHEASPVAFARFPGVDPPQLGKVGFDVRARQGGELDGRDQRGGGADGEADARALEDGVQEPRGGLPGRRRLGPQRPRPAPGQALDGRAQRGREQISRGPAGDHPDRADRSELAEAPEAGDRQRRVGGGGGDRRDQRAGQRAPDRLGERRLQRDRPAARRHVARQPDDPVVDAVADDDRSEETGARVQPIDAKRGERHQTERQHGRDGQRQEQQRQRRPPAEVEEDHQQHRDHDQDGRLAEIDRQGRQLLDGDGDVAGVADPQAGRVVPRAPEIAQVVLHAREQPARVAGAERRFGPLDQQQGHARLLVGVAAALARLARRGACGRQPHARKARLVLRLDVGEIERRRLVILVERDAEPFARVPAAPRLDPPADLDEVGEVDEQRQVRFQEAPLGGRLRPGLDRADERRRIGAHARGQIVDQPLGGGQL